MYPTSDPTAFNSLSPGPMSSGNRKGLTKFSSTVDRKSVPMPVLVPVLCVRIVPVPLAGKGLK